MKYKPVVLVVLCIMESQCSPLLDENYAKRSSEVPRELDLDYQTAVKLAELPLHCMYTEYPNHLQQQLQDETELLPPSELHPIFYGCFDWHSSVHGHWLLAKVANLFPDSEIFLNISKEFDNQFTTEKIDKELAYFTRESGKLFERTYGWAWLLKLQTELDESESESFRQYGNILRPLADYIADLYVEFLPRLVYPLRVGEHPNTAFGLVFALEYARGTEKLKKVVQNVSSEFYLDDYQCPLRYEPSGSDFISPCLQEADLMSRIIEDKAEFDGWLLIFLPQLFDPNFVLAPGEVIDRTDGKLVHLDGLNFSRAWALYNIAAKLESPIMKQRLVAMGDDHILKSIDYVVGSHYSGSHWLASFLFHALETRQRLM